MPLPVRANAFALGNGLVVHDNAHLYRRLAERAGLSPQEATLRLTGPLWNQANRGQVDAEGLRQGVCNLLGVDIPDAEFFELWSSHFTPNPSLFPHLETLAGQVPLVLLSNTNVLHIAWLRPRLPVLERFRHLLLSYEVGLVKPERAFFEEALRRAGTRPEETLFFDDMREYVDAALALGMRAHVFTDTESWVEFMRREAPELTLG